MRHPYNFPARSKVFLKAFTDKISIIHNSLIAFFPLYHSPIISTTFSSIFLSISSSFLMKALVEKISIKRIAMLMPVTIKYVIRTIFFSSSSDNISPHLVLSVKPHYFSHDVHPRLTRKLELSYKGLKLFLHPRTRRETQADDNAKDKRTRGC